MSIDPRIMKTLLQLQWMPSLDMNGTSQSDTPSTDSQNGNSLFSTLLQQMMSGTNTDSSLLSETGLQTPLILHVIGVSFPPHAYWIIR